jgi:biopolymer transport protein ExbD
VISGAKNRAPVKLLRTKNYQFGWLLVFPLLDVVFLMIFFLLLSSNFILQPGISVNVPFSKFMLAPQVKYQIVSITNGATVYFRDQKTSIDELGGQFDAARAEGRAIIIKADRYTPYETVIRVANLALEHGISSVALATTAPK